MNPIYLKTADYITKTSSETTQSDQTTQAAQTAAKQAPPPPAPTSEAPPPPKTDSEIISETLKENGFKPTEENKEMAKQMRDNGVPLTKENLQKMNQAVKLTQSTDKALFMLQNNAKLTQENANKVETLANELTKTKAQTEKLQTAVEEIKDKELAEQCKKILQENKDTTTKPQAKPDQNTAPPPQTKVENTTTEKITQEQPQQAKQTTEQTAPQTPSKNIPQNTPQPTPPTSPTPQTPPPTTEAPVQPPIKENQDTITAPQIKGENATTGKVTQEQPQQPQPTTQQPTHPMANTTPKTIEVNLQNLQETVTKLQQQIQQAPKPTPETTHALQEANTLESQIKTTDQIKNQIEIQPQQKPAPEAPDATPVKIPPQAKNQVHTQLPAPTPEPQQTQQPATQIKTPIHIKLPPTNKGAQTLALPNWEGGQKMTTPITVKSQTINTSAPPPTTDSNQTAPPTQALTTASTPTTIPTMPAAAISETLLTHGFKNTEENQTMLKQMLENGIPLTKENIQKMNQAMKLTQSSDKALFMIQNNMKLTQANAQQLEGLVSGQTKITNQLNNLLSAVEQLDNKILSEQLKQVLTGKTTDENVPTGKVTHEQPQQPQQTTAQTAPQAPPPPLPANLQFPLANSTPQSIENYLQNLRETLSQIQQQIQQATTSSPDTARVLQEARTLESHIDFTSQIRNQIYVQLPMFHNGEQTLTNLHIYTDAKNSAKGGKKKESSSALIALETANLGHFETYVQKTATAVVCQFRLDNEEITAAVRNNIHKLEALLRDSGYSLEQFSFLPPGEPYTLVNNPSKEAPINSTELALFDKTV